MITVYVRGVYLPGFEVVPAHLDDRPSRGVPWPPFPLNTDEEGERGLARICPPVFDARRSKPLPATHTGVELITPVARHNLNGD
ncbi:MAG: hypothetical protein CM15mP78_15610 [Candidatus Poseidoniales archaeon]|nr:MAG: hypothetical protein CM15mP78_15610 [Candidatus Poseidoniales archaeon]